MMSIVMFAIVGALINAPAGYWITYSVFCVLKMMFAIVKALNA